MPTLKIIEALIKPSVSCQFSKEVLANASIQVEVGRTEVVFLMQRKVGD
jgi:hypothetical protein